MLGPRPSAKKVFQLLPPGFRCFSPLSPFLLEFGSRHRRLAEELGPPGQSLPSGHPTHLSTGEVGALEVVGSVGVPSRPWVRAWASSSVSRRVEGPLPARDLGLGRRQRPEESGEGAAISPGAVEGHRQSQALQPKPRPRSVGDRRPLSNPSFATPQLGPLGSHQVSLNQGAFVHHVGTVTGGLPSRFAVVG